MKEEDFYVDTEGNTVFTAKYHLKRGRCCKSTCLHCPYGTTIDKFGLQFEQVNEKSLLKANQLIIENSVNQSLPSFLLKELANKNDFQEILVNEVKSYYFIILKGVTIGLLKTSEDKKILLKKVFLDQRFSDELIWDYFNK